MSIFIESIGPATFEVYGGLTACSNYLLGSSSAGAVAFRGLVVDDQKRRLIDATRYIDGWYWQGAATGLAGGTPTSLQFPRSSLTNVDGSPLDAANVPVQVVDATFEMAAILAVDAEAASAVDTGSNVASLGAGPAQISFFRPTSAADGNATVLPTVIDRLIGRWRGGAGAGGAFAGLATGVNPASNFLSCSCGSASCRCAEQRRDVRWPL